MGDHVPEKKEAPVEALRSDFAIGILVYASTAVIFYPLTRFLFSQTLGQEQLLHSFLVLAMAGAWLLYERRVRLKPAWELGRWARGLLVAAYVLLVTILFTGWSVLMIVSFSLTIASGVIWVFGERVKRFVGALVGAFAFFQFFVLLLPVADWPLRGIAGHLSGWVLHYLGRDVALQVFKAGEAPSLVLMSNHQPFVVAAECNGFGVIVSSFLLAALLILYRRIPIWTKAAAFLLSGLLGLVFNAVRITIIVMLAPAVGEKHYLLMHEIVGSITFYSTLLAIWFLIRKIPTRRPAAVPSAP